MIRSIKRLVLAGVAAATLMAVAFAGPASASVSFDPVSGTGFVGKGDVQTAFGWNNAKFQAEAANLSFSVVSTETWEWDEVWDTGNGKKVTHHSIDKSTTTSVNAQLAYDNRLRNQVTGIFLSGFKIDPPIVTGGPVPQNGDILVDRSDDRARDGSTLPTDSVAENVTMTGTSGAQLFVSDSNLGLGPVNITPAPVVS